MINSTDRKLMLSGWLQEADSVSYEAPLRLQKFLFFYEGFSKLEGDKCEFAGLRGYEKGPVFSAVFGDYGKERTDFDRAVRSAYQANKSGVDYRRAKLANFVIRVFSEEELSDITHRMNIWRCKKDRIDKGEPQVSLYENDLNEEDHALLRELHNGFSWEMVEGSEVISFYGKNFVLTKEDAQTLTRDHYSILRALARGEELENPVYVHLDGEVLLVD